MCDPITSVVRALESRQSRSRTRDILAVLAFSTLLNNFSAAPIFAKGDKDKQEGDVAEGSLAAWASGPVQWLLVQSEWKTLRKSKDSRDAAFFIESFWRRRDPDPLTDGNPFRELFKSRVAAADRLYFEEQDRGSLTDRGRALILLGSPSHVSITHQPSLIWADKTSSSQDTATRDQKVETWGFRLEDLPQGLLESTLRAGKKGDEALPLTLMFRHDGDRVRLMEGERLLALAAHSYILDGLP